MDAFAPRSSSDIFSPFGKKNNQKLSQSELFFKSAAYHRMGVGVSQEKMESDGGALEMNSY